MVVGRHQTKMYNADFIDNIYIKKKTAHHVCTGDNTYRAH